jgi:hypothetical protein
MRRRLRLIGAACALCAFAPVVAHAANTITMTPPATASFGVTLDGADKIGTYSLAIPVSYTSNSGNKFATLGWHITATSTTLKGTSTLKTLSTSASTITAFSDSAGCTNPTCTDAVNSIGYPLGIPAGTAAPTAISVYSANATTGQGNNALTMQVSVAVPANTYADTYTSTLTLAIAEGP